jgi:hypothetical protein
MNEQFATSIADLEEPGNYETLYSDSETVKKSAKEIALQLNKELDNKDNSNTEYLTQVQKLEEKFENTPENNDYITYIFNRYIKNSIKKDYMILLIIIVLINSEEFWCMLHKYVSFLGDSNSILVVTLKGLLIVLLYHISISLF